MRLTSVSAVLRGRRLPYQPPLFHWSLALLIGAALSLTGAAAWIVAISALVSALFAWSSATRSDVIGSVRWPVALLLMTPALIGIGYWRAEQTMLPPAGLATADFAGQSVSLAGRVADEPQVHGAGMRLLLHARSIELADERREIDARVQLFLPDAPEVALGDPVRVEATLTPVRDAATELRAYLDWLERRGIAASGLASPGGLVVIGERKLGWPRSWAADARHALNESLRAALPPPLSGIAQGMITGRRDAIDSELRSSLNDTSLSHLIVISGSNLTLLTSLVMVATGWALGRRGAALLAIAAALSYGALIGPDPPVQRAMWMAIVFAAAHLFGRGASALYAVVATAALMTTLQPSLLLDLSFQLTLAGTLGIVVLMPSVSLDFLSGRGGAGGVLRDAALVTLVASLATLPLIVLHFERAALIGILANFLVAPLFSWMLLGSAATALIGIVSEITAHALAWALAWLPLRWLALVAEQGGQLPGAGEEIRGFRHAHLLIVYGIILLASARPHRERIQRWYRSRADTPHRSPGRYNIGLIPELRSHLMLLALVGLAAATAAALWLSVAAETERRLQVHFIDVGQGDAALIVTPQRQTILIDTGEQSDALLAALRRYMPANARRIDLLVVTHPQSDHVEALWPLLDHYDIQAALVSTYLEETTLGQRVRGLLDDRAIPTATAHPGERYTFPGELELVLDVLWPPASGLPDSYLSDPNATSIVIRARYGAASLLLTGDINVEQELDLVREPCPGSIAPCKLQADVLKVAHQGSRNSSASLFLDAVAPTLAVISAGVDNLHGHPHAEVLDSLTRVGAETLVTSEHGDITIATDGRTLSVRTER